MLSMSNWPKLPAWHDPQWWRAFALDLRPAMLGVHIRHQQVNIRWMLPMTVVESTLQALIVIAIIATRLPPGRALRRAVAKLPVRLDPNALMPLITDSAWLTMLRLPPGHAYVDIEVGDHLRLRIASM